jgi:hypothetical protein
VNFLAKTAAGSSAVRSVEHVGISAIAWKVATSSTCRRARPIMKPLRLRVGEREVAVHVPEPSEQRRRSFAGEVRRARASTLRIGSAATCTDQLVAERASR